MARLLIVHHTTSPSTQAMLEAVLEGARTDEIDGVEVVTRAALAATAVDVLAADAVILGTPANIGYMSGALKHFFDQVYYPCLSETAGLPYTLSWRPSPKACPGTGTGRPSPWSANCPARTGKRAGSWARSLHWPRLSVPLPAPPEPGRRGRAAPIPTGPPRGTDTAVSAVDPPQEMPPVHNVPGHRLVDRPLSVPRNGQVGADRDVLVWPELHDLAVERAANVLHTFASHTSQDGGNNPLLSVK